MAGLKKQVNVNTKRMKVLMKDIRNDVYSRTKNSKSIDEWLQKLHPYVGENCLINGIHGEEVGKIIRNIVNTTEMTKLPPGANQEIVKGVMSEACMTYVTNVGKDIQTELQKIAVEGYNNKMAPKELANEMANKIDTLSRTRAQTIARTETMRANNLSNLIAAKENGAKSYTISCDDAACDLCLEVYGDEEDVVFDIDDTDNFPPFHPNCRCTPRFSTKPVEQEETVEYESIEEVEDTTDLDINGNKLLTPEQLSEMSFESLAEHHGATYEGVETYDYDGRKYHTFKQTFDNGKSLTLRFEASAIKSYSKAGIVTPNEIVNEVFKVPTALKRETDEIWFKNTNHGILTRPTSKSKYDTLGNMGGYNAYHGVHRRGKTIKGKVINDVNHRIVISPRYFNGGGKGKNAHIWKRNGENGQWKFTIHHEFTHSIDLSREAWLNSKTSTNATQLCYSDEYSKIHREEIFFTQYANTKRAESFAEHGGYISYMLANPLEQSKTIPIERIEKGKIIKEDINFEQYKKMYPKHYAYFVKLIKG